jgi:dihydroflavonol-4-reductase
LPAESVRLSLVSGAAGFVGKSLVEILKARGERVRGLDLAPCAADEAIVGSIRDADVAARAVDGVDCVFHLAGNAQLWAKDPREFDAVNRGGTVVMLEAARRAGVRRFVHCSSLTTLVGAGAARRGTRADESVRLSPGEMLGPYPRSKREAELAVEAAVQGGLDAVVAIPTEPLGPGDEAMTPPTRLIADIVAGRLPAYVDCLLNFVPVESLARGLVAARDRGRRGERYLLGGRDVPMSDLIAALERVAGVRGPRTRLPIALAYAAGVVDTFLAAPLTGSPPRAPLTGVRLAARQVGFSSEKAARELGWSADDFEPALARAVAWLRETGRAC